MNRYFKLILLFLIPLNSCAYRFSNLHARPPKGVRTIAVEAIYDSSQVPLPHDLLWKSLQQAVAASGHLRLSSTSQADAILRINIENASLSSSGVPAGNLNPVREPRIQESSVNPPAFDKFEPLTIARALYPDNTLGILVTAEVWNLTSKQLILQRSYTFSNAFRAFRGDQNANNSSKSNFVQYQEALNNSVSKIGNQIAARIVSDLLVQ